jgi:putative flippase GtrA
MIDFLLSWFRTPRSRITWFCAVGAVAALTHVFVFSFLRHVMWPELANLGGFAIAFFVSFAGHRFLSFSDTTRSAPESFWRFFVTAVSGFVGNEIVFVLFYRFVHLPSMLTLFIALVAAAVQTFVLSRYWAFKA